MSRLLITGGAGFIGANFVLHWLREHPDDRVGAVALVTDVLFGTVTTTIVVVLGVGMFGTLWLGLPLRRRLKYRNEGLPLLDPPEGG